MQASNYSTSGCSGSSFQSNSIIDDVLIELRRLDEHPEDSVLHETEWKPEKSSSLAYLIDGVFNEMPAEMMMLYEQADLPPALSKLNFLRFDGKDTLKFYTDPGLYSMYNSNESVNTAEVKADQVDHETLALYSQPLKVHQNISAIDENQYLEPQSDIPEKAVIEIEQFDTQFIPIPQTPIPLSPAPLPPPISFIKQAVALQKSIINSTVDELEAEQSISMKPVDNERKTFLYEIKQGISLKSVPGKDPTPIASIVEKQISQSLDNILDIIKLGMAERREDMCYDQSGSDSDTDSVSQF